MRSEETVYSVACFFLFIFAVCWVILFKKLFRVSNGDPWSRSGPISSCHAWISPSVCQQFVSRSGPTSIWAWSWSNRFAKIIRRPQITHISLVSFGGTSASSVNPDQTLQKAGSDHGIYLYRVKQFESKSGRRLVGPDLDLTCLKDYEQTTLVDKAKTSRRGPWLLISVPIRLLISVPMEWSHQWSADVMTTPWSAYVMTTPWSAYVIVNGVPMKPSILRFCMLPNRRSSMLPD